MPASSQNISGTVAIVLTAPADSREITISQLSIANRTSGALTFDIFKYDGTNSYYIVPPSTPIGAYAPIILTGITLQAGWSLKVTTSGSCDVDCNYKL